MAGANPFAHTDSHNGKQVSDGFKGPESARFNCVLKHIFYSLVYQYSSLLSVVIRQKFYIDVILQHHKSIDDRLAGSNPYFETLKEKGCHLSVLLT